MRPLRQHSNVRSTASDRPAAAFTGFLASIRESGVLLPRRAIAAYVRRLPQRKPVWPLGGALSIPALFGTVAAAEALKLPEVGEPFAGGRRRGRSCG